MMEDSAMNCPKYVSCCGTTAGTAVLLVLLAGCYKPEQPKTSANISDTTITAQVKAAIVREPLLKTNDIAVETRDGTVQLRGAVHSTNDVVRAADIAQSIDGVKAVRNDVQVR